MRRKKRLRELAHGSGDHRICRELIEREGLVPHVLANSEGMFWDGCNAIDRTGKNVGGVSGSMQKEMIKMIVEGRYGEAIKDAFFDGSMYWKIRDDLITWPDQKKIDQYQLRVVPVDLLPNTTSTAASV